MKSNPHNGTINGQKSKKQGRREREDERQAFRDENPQTPRERIASLDARGLTATKERKKLLARVR